ncbi:copper chaperone [Streptomyces phaeochromogenes]|jgi:copper chaperone CopZ|uniref:heavy-metal-associated domain-containing protein n=1 Tax=Streptomyces TaxID=1883 RepID=UPI00117FFFF3|nr:MULTISPECIES: heavy-metal-associated domain-containing protein [Streptomyces]MDQ0947458.1 copper chaperone [Streptomyces phaeochromogenes]TRO60541.1 copper chaperone [Streptomyces sp. IB201691-2A2]
MTEQRYHVIGMTCGRCADTLETRVGGVFGVDRVGIDLDTGSVTVTGEALDGSKVCAAITEAGFEVAAVL